MTKRRERQALADLIRRNERIRAGMCVECGKPNDRAGLQTKAHRIATRCTACLTRLHESQATNRRAAQERRGELAAALGLTPEQAEAVTKQQRAK